MKRKETFHKIANQREENGDREGVGEEREEKRRRGSVLLEIRNFTCVFLLGILTSVGKGMEKAC